jgi:hypothetical protein
MYFLQKLKASVAPSNSPEGVESWVAGSKLRVVLAGEFNLL